MKRTATWIAAVLFVLPATVSLRAVEGGPAATAWQAARSKEKPSGYTLTVLNPQGAVKKVRDLAPRLGTLQGKKVAMWLSSTSDQLYAGRGAELYDVLAKMLKEKFPAIRIVPYRDLPMKFTPESDVVAAIVAKQPDAVVAGFGG